MKKKACPYESTLVVDTETTGLLKPEISDLDAQPKIIEIGIVELDKHYKVIAEHSWLIDPCEPLEAVINKITGLTDDDLRGKPTFVEVLPELIEAFIGRRRMVAHNLPFDHGMFVNDLRRCNQDHAFPWPPVQHCTVQIASEMIYGRHAKLIELYEDTFGKPLDQTHRALDDARALADILREKNW